MKKALTWIGMAAMVLLLAAQTGVYAAEEEGGAAPDAFMSADEARAHAESFIETFNMIVEGGGTDQYAGIWVYDILLNWQALLDEIGRYMGIKSSTASVDGDVANIRVLVEGSKKNAVVDIVLRADAEPEVHMQSSFSLDKAIQASGLMSILTLINTLALIIVIIILVRHLKHRDKKGCGEAVVEKSMDGTIARIVEKEEGDVEDDAAPEGEAAAGPASGEAAEAAPEAAEAAPEAAEAPPEAAEAPSETTEAVTAADVSDNSTVYKPTEYKPADDGPELTENICP